MRALGVDYGERRIGLALSDPTGLLARPWKTMANDGNLRAAAARIGEEVRALRTEPDGLSVIVLGHPRRLSGEANAQTPRVDAIADLLTHETDVPVVLQDERLTSHAADELLASREKDWRRRKKEVDAMAAAVILQDYLDHQPRR